MKTDLQEKKVCEKVKLSGLRHIAVIMDGNRRWAKERGLPSAFGHKRGVESLKTTLRACKDFGIKYLTVYAFSTENWNRKQDEVDFLMDLLAKTLKAELAEMHANGVVIKFIGDVSALNPKLQVILSEAEEQTRANTGVHLQIAFNYGARAELVQAVRRIVDSGVSAADISEELISQNLYTSGMPDPDLLIRTGGEKRISNYLLWQIAYSELLVVPEYWPEFDRESLAEAIEEFYTRQRRYGK